MIEIGVSKARAYYPTPYKLAILGQLLCSFPFNIILWTRWTNTERKVQSKSLTVKADGDVDAAVVVAAALNSDASLRSLRGSIRTPTSTRAPSPASQPWTASCTAVLSS